MSKIYSRWSCCQSILKNWWLRSSRMETIQPRRSRQIVPQTNKLCNLQQRHRREAVEKTALQQKLRRIHFGPENLKWSVRDVSNRRPDPVPVHRNLLHKFGAEKCSPRPWDRRLDRQHQRARRLGLPLRRHQRQHGDHRRNTICAASHRLRFHFHSIFEIKSKEDQFFGSPSARRRRRIRKQVWDWAISTGLRQIHCHSIHKRTTGLETTLLASGRERHHPPNHCLISMGNL